MIHDQIWKFCILSTCIFHWSKLIAMPHKIVQRSWGYTDILLSTMCIPSICANGNFKSPLVSRVLSDGLDCVTPRPYSQEGVLSWTG